MSLNICLKKKELDSEEGTYIFGKGRYHVFGGDKPNKTYMIGKENGTAKIDPSTKTA